MSSRSTEAEFLHPLVEPYKTEMVQVGANHQIYVECVGNPDGIPAVFLHGGPGGAIMPSYRKFFDPKVWNLIIFDQRGCGKSIPYAELNGNTTWDLVADIETLRERYGVEKWLVFGGSWGSTLALAYAQTHPERCTGLILRGIFMCRRWELEWFYQEGASALYPDYWQPYLEQIPLAERGDMIAAYYKRLTSSDRNVRMQAARAWCQWEAATSRLRPDAQRIADAAEDHFAEAMARIECHYFVNKAFFESDDQLLRDAYKLKDIPGVIVHGRYDVVCPLKNAWDLQQKWPKAVLKILDDCGHSMVEDGIARELVDAVNIAKTWF